MAAQTVSAPVDHDLPVADRCRVIVTADEIGCSVRVHHREIPELCAEGESPRAAALNLEQDLAREIDFVADARRRGPFLRAASDVRAFIEAGT